jgi:hypothetical protein
MRNAHNIEHKSLMRDPSLKILASPTTPKPHLSTYSVSKLEALILSAKTLQKHTHISPNFLPHPPPTLPTPNPYCLHILKTLLSRFTNPPQIFSG